MPVVTQTHQIDISPMKHLQACSPIEIQEINILLSSFLDPLAQKRYDDNVMVSLKVLVPPDEYESIKIFVKHMTGPRLQAFHDLLVLLGSTVAAKEALKIVETISDDMNCCPTKVVPAMRMFMTLENIRRNAMIKKPQLLNNQEE